MGMGNNGKGKDAKWKNFLSLWERSDAGALAATGNFSLEAFCRVLKDQNVTTVEGAREIFLVLKKHIPSMEMQVACWTNQQRSGKQPNFQIGYNPPRDTQGSCTQASAPEDEVPF